MEKRSDAQTHVAKPPGYLGKQKRIFPKVQLKQPCLWNPRPRVPVLQQTLPCKQTQGLTLLASVRDLSPRPPWDLWSFGLVLFSYYFHILPADLGSIRH